MEGLQLDPRNPMGALVYAWTADDSRDDGGEGGEGEEGHERERSKASGKGQSAAETMDPNLGGKPAGLNAAAIDVVQLSPFSPLSSHLPPPVSRQYSPHCPPFLTLPCLT